MAVSLQDVVRETDGMEASAFLRYLVRDAFPDKVLVTASLRARSIVTLRMIADVAPSTPVVFCHAKDILPESLEYRAYIVETLGLTEVRPPKADTGRLPGDTFHRENLWFEDPVDQTHRYSTVRLNQTLETFDCWISAVYQGPYSDEPRPRVTQEGRLVRVDPLAGWSKEKVRGYLKERDLPFHPKAMQRGYQPVAPLPYVPSDDYHY